MVLIPSWSFLLPPNPSVRQQQQPLKNGCFSSNCRYRVQNSDWIFDSSAGKTLYGSYATLWLLHSLSWF